MAKHEVVSMILDPASRRQVGEEGLFVLWRDGPSPGRRDGLACIVSMCPNPRCMCRDVHVDCFLIDEQAGVVTWDDEDIKVTEASGTSSEDLKLERKLSAIVDPDSGGAVAGPDFREEADPAILEWLASELDGELLEALHRRRGRLKGYPPERPVENPELDEIERDHLVGFNELFKGGRSDDYILNGIRYWATLFLCPDADCDCGELRVVFFDDAAAPEAEAGGAVGSVMVRLTGTEGLEVMEMVPEGVASDDGLVRELWALFQRRHDVGRFFRRREVQAKAVGATLLRPIAKPLRAAPKIERNAPCPCGSGVKYKRCCLGKEPSEKLPRA